MDNKIVHKRPTAIAVGSAKSKQLRRAVAAKRQAVWLKLGQFQLEYAVIARKLEQLINSISICMAHNAKANNLRRENAKIFEGRGAEGRNFLCSATVAIFACRGAITPAGKSFLPRKKIVHAITIIAFGQSIT